MRDSVSVRAAKQWTVLIARPHTGYLQPAIPRPCVQSIWAWQAWVTEEQLTAPAEDDGHGGETQIQRVCQQSVL